MNSREVYAIATLGVTFLAAVPLSAVGFSIGSCNWRVGASASAVVALWSIAGIGYICTSPDITNGPIFERGMKWTVIAHTLVCAVLLAVGIVYRGKCFGRCMYVAGGVSLGLQIATALTCLGVLVYVVSKHDCRGCHGHGIDP